jgi:hypothetical protein
VLHERNARVLYALGQSPARDLVGPGQETMETRYHLEAGHGYDGYQFIVCVGILPYKASLIYFWKYSKLWCMYNLCPHIMFANSTGDVCDVWWDQQWKFQSVTAGLRTAQPIALESLQIFGRQVELEESKIPASEKHDDEMDIDQDNLKDMIDVMNTEQFVPVPPPMPVTKLIEIGTCHHNVVLQS